MNVSGKKCQWRERYENCGGKLKMQLGHSIENVLRVKAQQTERWKHGDKQLYGG